MYSKLYYDKQNKKFYVKELNTEKNGDILVVTDEQYVDITDEIVERFVELFQEYIVKEEQAQESEDSNTAPVRFEEEDGEKYPVVDYKLMGRKAAELSVEDKQLVLKDISARVPYKVKFQNENIPTPNVATLDMTYLRMFEIREGVIFKPYLRPRSSMTEAEKDEEFKMCSLNCSEWEMADFFNKHHLDYHGLIEKGLAIEAPEDMYKND